MDFVFIPTVGPRRLIRYGPLPYLNMVSQLDIETNVLLVDGELYDRLEPLDKHRVLGTRAPFTTIDEHSRLVEGEGVPRIE